MGFIVAVGDALRKGFDSRGRASRVEFWSFLLVCLLCYAAFGALSVVAFPSSTGSPGAVAAAVASLTGVLFVVVLIGPLRSVAVRRLHDSGRRAAWQLLIVLGPLGIIALLALFCLPGDAGDNLYGPPPAPPAGNATVTRGMTGRQVTGLLGPPHERTGRHPRERDYWHYIDLPYEGRETMITFEMGRVVDITTA